MKLARHTIILIIAAVVLLAAAFISLISEKLSVNRLYEDLLNGREPEPDLELKSELDPEDIKNEPGTDETIKD